VPGRRHERRAARKAAWSWWALATGAVNNGGRRGLPKGKKKKTEESVGSGQAGATRHASRARPSVAPYRGWTGRDRARQPSPAACSYVYGAATATTSGASASVGGRTKRGAVTGTRIGPPIAPPCLSHRPRKQCSSRLFLAG